MLRFALIYLFMGWNFKKASFLAFKVQKRPFIYCTKPTNWGSFFNPHILFPQKSRCFAQNIETQTEKIGVSEKNCKKRTLISFYLALNWPLGFILLPIGVEFQVELHGTKKSHTENPQNNETLTEDLKCYF